MPPHTMVDNLVGDLLEQQTTETPPNWRKAAESWVEQEAMAISGAGLDVRKSTSVNDKSRA